LFPIPLQITKINWYKEEIENLLLEIKKKKGFVVSSLLKTELSYYFKIKLEEYNLILGNQQLIAIDQLMNLLKNKNKYEKMESLKRLHIQKCVNWCERYKIPNNKFLFSIHHQDFPSLPPIKINNETIESIF
jgi:hypothetical protein